MKHQNVPEWKLERYVLGELPEADMQMIQGALKSDDSLQERYNAILESDAEIRESLPPLQFETATVEETSPSTLEQLSERIKEFLHVPTLRPVGAFAMLMLVVGVVTMINRNETSISTPSIDNKPEVLIKGDSNIRIYRKEIDDDTVRLDSGAIAHEGDLLQIEYLAKNTKYGFIFSLDGNGVITRHLPIEGENAVEVVNFHATFLPKSYQLDNAPKYEKFYFVTSLDPFSLREIERSVELMYRKGSDTIRLDTSKFDQFLITLKKE